MDIKKEKFINFIQNVDSYLFNQFELIILYYNLS